eukprot:TRINITY_DN67436_c4_g6_i1.p2 TRINITY_DN67436_c4_g6~~TRINITY_DN67436_c4_g6_i1.p2  ORF type:complete len:179 (-),score=21.85 TRINITY_DN67436_c4_g6_i1:1058-1594(-)
MVLSLIARRSHRILLGPSKFKHKTPAPQFSSSAFAHINIAHGEIITDRKSRFQAHCATVNSVDEVDYVVYTLRTEKKIADATHPTIFAYRIIHPTTDQIISHRDDDGEGGAADKLLFLLDKSEAQNVLVVVTRWYGGINLGPDRFKHITNVAKELLQEQGYIKAKKDEKAKGKKGKKT